MSRFCGYEEVSPHLHIKSMWVISVILNIIDLDWSVPARPVALIMDDKIVRLKWPTYFSSSAPLSQNRRPNCQNANFLCMLLTKSATQDHRIHSMATR